MSEYFPKAKLCTGNVKIELDLSNYMTKAELKKVAHFVKKSDLASLKSEADKLDIDKLETILVYFSKLSVLS